MNIQAFSMISAAYVNPTAYGDFHGANYWVWSLCHLLADEKFMTIFSMLFGAGIFLMSSHIEAAGKNPAALHFRRMGWLILFGLSARLSALVRRHPGELRALRIAGLSLPQGNAAKVNGLRHRLHRRRQLALLLHRMVDSALARAPARSLHRQQTVATHARYDREEVAAYRSGWLGKCGSAPATQRSSNFRDFFSSPSGASKV